MWFAAWTGRYPREELLAFAQVHDLGKYNMDALCKAHDMVTKAFPDTFPRRTGPTTRKFVERFRDVTILEEDIDRG